MSVQSEIDRLNAVKERIRTNLVAQGITVPADTMLDAMAEQILSVAGQRGTGLLPVTTAPSGYTTAVGGITPKYRMAISTIKTQAGVTEVLLGDTVRYSYYHYPIAYLDASYAYFTTRVSIRGATGDDGKTAYEYATDGGYKGTAEEFAAKLAAETVYVGAEEPTDESVKLWFNPDGAPSTTVQTDWNQTDETAPDFLKNKPFGSELTEIMPETELIAGGEGYADLSALTLTGGEKALLITFDGIEYICEAGMLDGVLTYGNPAILGMADTGEPFLLAVISGQVKAMYFFDAKPHTVSIFNYIIQKIESKYTEFRTVFYIGDDDYTYSDFNYSKIVTKEEMLAAYSKTSVFLNYAGMAELPILYLTSWNEFASAAVCINVNDDGTQELALRYTAEYTG